MKYLVVSDIHGSIIHYNMLDNIIDMEKPDKIILLGDLFYHGPSDYSPLYDYTTPSRVLNKYKDIILCTRGNCDNDDDEDAMEFEFQKYIILTINKKKFFFSHGNIYNMENDPDTDFDVMIYGHLHTGFIIENDGKIYANPGSLSHPRGGTVNSYLTIDENTIRLKDLEGKVLDKIKYTV